MRKIRKRRQRRRRGPYRNPMIELAFLMGCLEASDADIRKILKKNSELYGEAGKTLNVEEYLNSSSELFEEYKKNIFITMKEKTKNMKK